MTTAEKNRVDAVIQNLAQREGIPSEEVRKRMQESIDAAWDSQDPDAQAYQRQLFPAGKPTLEAFIVRLAREI